MLRTIQFYNQLCLVAKEINDIISDNILTAELMRIFSQKSVPQDMFFFSWIFTQLLRQCFYILIAFHRLYLSNESTYLTIDIAVPHPTSLALGHLPPGGRVYSIPADLSFCIQHFLYFLPLPQGQGSLGPALVSLRTGCFFTTVA